MTRFAALTLAWTLTGCFDAQTVRTGAIPATCTKLGAKCQLPDGPLGVCDYGPCPPSDEKKGTCLRCVSQH